MDSIDQPLRIEKGHSEQIIHEEESSAILETIVLKRKNVNFKRIIELRPKDDQTKPKLRNSVFEAKNRQYHHKRADS